MILNVGGRTDIVNHYSDWLMNRFRAGYVCQRNPLFPNKVIRYEIAPDKIDAVLFCSKNYSAFLDRAALLAAEYRTYFHYTITPYGKDWEPNIPGIEESAETLLALSARVGKQRVAWRYDPVFITKTYPIERHLAVFEGLASKFSGKIDRCIFGFVENMVKGALLVEGLTVPSREERRALAAGFGKIAAKYKIPIQICHEDGYPEYGVAGRGCVTLDILGKANGCSFREIKHNGNRRGCACIESRDIGSYQTCPNLCKYCYANTDQDLVHQNHSMHNVDSPLLIGEIQPSDTVLIGTQTSYLKNDGKQISLFDL